MFGQLVIKPQKNDPVQAVTETPSSLFKEMYNALQTPIFSGSFAKKKSSLIKEVSDITVVKQNISTLATNIKSNSYKNGFSSAAIVKLSNTATTNDQVIDLLKNFEASLKPQSFSAVWQLERKNWLLKLDHLKKNS